MTLAPGRDDTTRGAEEMVGAAGWLGADGGVGETGVDAGVDAAAGAGASACGAGVAAGSETISTAAGATTSAASVFFLARDLAGAFFSFASPSAGSAAFFVFFGLSGAGSRFRPFSSA